MSEGYHRAVYTKHLSLITQTVNVDELLPKLLSNGCVSSRDYEKVKKKQSTNGTTAAAELLFSEMLLRNPDGESFIDLRQALEEAGHRVLAKTLQEEYDKQAESPPPIDVMNQKSALRRKHLHTFKENGPIPVGHSPHPQLYSPYPRTGACRDPSIRAHVSNPHHQCATQKVGSLNPVEQAAMTSVPQVDAAEFCLDRNNRLGCGSFGTVYKSNWRGTDVAVKEVPLQLRKKTKDQDIASLTQEIQISARIRHPNIVTVMAYAFNKDGMCIVYELIDGQNLENVLFDEDTTQIYHLSIPDRLHIAKQICQAVSYLHALEPMVIHSDIKPANILVSQHGLVSKLCDLGLSKVKSKHSHISTILQNAGGTPLYMAPEMLIYNKSATTKTDVYALGATLLELFTESEMWEGQDTRNMDYIRQCMAAYVPPTSVSKLSDGVLKALIMGCLSYTEDNRPTALQVVEKLNNIKLC